MLRLIWEGRARAFRLLDKHRERSHEPTIWKAEAYEECAKELAAALHQPAKPAQKNPRTFLARCQRLRLCGFAPNCVCDVDPTDPRDIAVWEAEQLESTAKPAQGDAVASAERNTP